MTVGLKTRLFLVSLALVAAVGAVSSIYLEFELRRWLETNTSDELVVLGRSYLAGLENDVLARAKPEQFYQATKTDMWFFDEENRMRLGSADVSVSLQQFIDRNKHTDGMVHLERDEGGAISSVYAFIEAQHGTARWWLVLKHGPERIQETLDRMRFLHIILKIMNV